MKLEWTQAGRWPSWPWWSMVLLLLWLLLGGTVLLLAASTGGPLPVCLFRRLTGCPCPTCGFARGALSFLQGQPVQGWLYNPLLFSFLGVLTAVVGIRVLFGRGPHVDMTPRERAAAWPAALLFSLLNWLYVIHYVG